MPDRRTRRLPRGLFRVYLRLGGDADLLFVLIAAAAFGFAGFVTHRDGQLTREGVTVEAQIVDKERVTKVDGRSGGETTSHRITVRFVPEGQDTPVVVRHTVSRRFYERVGRGTVEVVYLPDDPQVVQIDPFRLAQYVWVALITGVITLGLALVHGAILLRRGLPALRVRDGGRTTEGTVVHFDKERQEGCWRIDFTDHKGKPRTAWTLPSPRRHHDGLAEGATVTVHFAPQDPTRAYWAGDVA